MEHTKELKEIFQLGKEEIVSCFAENNLPIPTLIDEKIKELDGFSASVKYKTTLNEDVEFSMKNDVIDFEINENPVYDNEPDFPWAPAFSIDLQSIKKNKKAEPDSYDKLKEKTLSHIDASVSYYRTIIRDDIYEELEKRLDKYLDHSGLEIFESMYKTQDESKLVPKLIQIVDEGYKLIKNANKEIDLSGEYDFEEYLEKSLKSRKEATNIRKVVEAATCLNEIGKIFERETFKDLDKEIYDEIKNSEKKINKFQENYHGLSRMAEVLVSSLDRDSKQR